MVCSQRFYYILFHFAPVTRVWVEAQTTRSPATSSSPSGGTHRCSWGLMGSVVPPACHKSASGSPLNWTRVVHVPRETSRRRPDQMAERQAAAALGCLRLLTISPCLSSATLQRKLISAARIHHPPGHALFNTPQRPEKFHYFKYKPLKI